jgi:ubiquinone/menaquinone biosynthesis C-methylase UbiE
MTITADRLRWDNASCDYDEKILSPFSKGVKNPLFKYIDKLDKDTVVADFGCGTGRLVEILSKKKFKKVCGIDYSGNMLKMAIKRCASLNVEYKNMNITNLSELYEKIDIAFAINSILPIDPNDTPKMIQEIYNALKPGGLFIAILPSFDTILYLKKLWLEDYFNKLESKRKAKLKNNFPYPIANWLKKEKNKWKAELATYLEFRKRKLNMTKHLYVDDFVNVQRFIHENEIRPLLEKTGFKILYKDKVTYPWKLCKKYNYDYFPGNDEIWDWFVVAKK